MTALIVVLIAALVVVCYRAWLRYAEDRREDRANQIRRSVVAMRRHNGPPAEKFKPTVNYERPGKLRAGEYDWTQQ